MGVFLHRGNEILGFQILWVSKCFKIMEKIGLHGLCLILLLTCGCFGRIVQKCHLAGEMLKIAHPNYAPDKIDLWLCIAEKASNYNTSAISKTKFTEELRLGIFMIPGNKWCKSPSKKESILFPERLYNRCHIECEKFLDDDLTDDLACLTKVYEEDPSYWLEPFCAECRLLTPVGKFIGCSSPTIPSNYFETMGTNSPSIPPIDSVKVLGSSGSDPSRDFNFGVGFGIGKHGLTSWIGNPYKLLPQVQAQSPAPAQVQAQASVQVQGQAPVPQSNNATAAPDTRSGGNHNQVVDSGASDLNISRPTTTGNDNSVDNDRAHHEIGKGKKIKAQNS